jgi:hypothetical protein
MQVVRPILDAYGSHEPRKRRPVRCRTTFAIKHNDRREAGFQSEGRQLDRTRTLLTWRRTSVSVSMSGMGINAVNDAWACSRGASTRMKATREDAIPYTHRRKAPRRYAVLHSSDVSFARMRKNRNAAINARCSSQEGSDSRSCLRS